MATPMFIFEDAGWRRFGPLTTLRPAWELFAGLETLGNRISRRLDRDPHGYLARSELNGLLKEHYGEEHVASLPERGDVFLVNGRILGDVPAEGLESECPHTVWTDRGDVVAAKLPVQVVRKWFSLPVFDPTDFGARNLLALWGRAMGVPEVRILESENSLAFWPWDLLHKQEELIRNALSRVGDGTIDGDVDPRAILVEETAMHVAGGAKVAAGAILDASAGPIILGEGVTVQPGAILIGPLAIGRGSLVKAGAKLHGPLSTGPVCKLGGEIEESIFIGYSNKQHEGYLGNSLVGEWVNLGADTNNSDLKNNYSPVSATIAGETVSTGSSFFGAIIGDHVKTAINTQLNTGTVIGIATSIFGAGFPPKTIGAFRWGGAEGFEFYDFDKFLATAKVVMSRRDVELTHAMAAVLRQTHSDALAGRL